MHFTTRGKTIHALVAQEVRVWWHLSLIVLYNTQFVSRTLKSVKFMQTLVFFSLQSPFWSICPFGNKFTSTYGQCKLAITRAFRYSKWDCIHVFHMPCDFYLRVMTVVAGYDVHIL
jgi:hypothetical protein